MFPFLDFIMLRLFVRQCVFTKTVPAYTKPLLQTTSLSLQIQNDYHGNRSYMARKSKKPKTKNLFNAVERLSSLKRGERYKDRYTDKYGRRSEKFVPVHKLPAPRWAWDGDLTKESSDFLKDINTENNEALEQDLIKYNPLKDKDWPLEEWSENSLRIGAIGVKLGVQRMWLKDGTAVNTTLIQIQDCNVIKYFSKDEYNGRSAAVILGARNATPFYRNENYLKFCLDAGVPIKQKCYRFIISENARLKPGTPIKASHFRVGQYVDCCAKTVGYGFQGVMQRFHAKGGKATHGNHGWHRRIGSIGDRSGHVTKGRTMPGQLGGTYETVKKLKILRINHR